MNRFFPFFSFAILVFASASCGFARQGLSSKVPLTQEKMNGLCWVGSDSIVVDNFKESLQIGAKWVSLTAFGEMEAYNRPSIKRKENQHWWGDTDQGIIQSARVAHEAGMKVMLKPHITMPRDPGYWRHDIKMQSDDQWVEWFDNYSRWIMSYAKMAAEANIEMLCIGTELYQPTTQYPDQWSLLIRKVRQVYPGKLTYAANWYQEVDEITFWKELDYIGVQGYYPLGHKKTPSKLYLKKKWKKYKKRLAQLSDKYNRAVIFTEMGYKNTVDAHSKPWEWPQDLGTKAIRSDETQHVAYEAFFESFWKESWVAGAFVWNWHHPTYKIDSINDYFLDRERRMELWGSQIGKKIDSDIYFSPQGRPAYGVLEKWFLN